MFGKDKKRGERCKDFIKTEDSRPPFCQKISQAEVFRG
jgi:hypothetical protein